MVNICSWNSVKYMLLNTKYNDRFLESPSSPKDCLLDKRTLNNNFFKDLDLPQGEEMLYRLILTNSNLELAKKFEEKGWILRLLKKMIKIARQGGNEVLLCSFNVEKPLHLSEYMITDLFYNSKSNIKEKLSIFFGKDSGFILSYPYTGKFNQLHQEIVLSW